MRKKCYFLFLILSFWFQTMQAQSCDSLLKRIDIAIKRAENNLDSIIRYEEIPKSPEIFVVYSVVNRYYNSKYIKQKDTTLIRKFRDFQRVTWCFRGVCFNNNRAFNLGKSQILEKIQNNDLRNSVERETICVLCDKYNLDSTFIIKLLDYEDTTNLVENANAHNYGLLHRALQLTNLQNNKCITNEIFNRYSYPLIDTIHNTFIINNESDGFKINAFDLFSEAVLMISVLDKNINLSDDYYRRILDMQLPDGGWSMVENSKISNNHTTMVSLWALLEYKKKLKSFSK